LVVVYSNRNVVVYESNFRVLRNLKHHCDTIWGIIPITTKQDELSHSFVTYSQDGLVRVWNSGCLLSSITGDQIPVLQETLVADVLAESNFKKISGPGSNNDIKDVKLGIRSMAIDPTGTLIACGDRNGTLK
jgi:WD40 repeat protein